MRKLYAVVEDDKTGAERERVGEVRRRKEQNNLKS